MNRLIKKISAVLGPVITPRITAAMALQQNLKILAHHAADRDEYESTLHFLARRAWVSERESTGAPPDGIYYWPAE